MRLTLFWICVCLAIYCSGGFANNGQGNVVLSLPPSLIAATEAVALRQNLHHHERPLWKKDARVLFDSNSNGGNDAPRDMAHSKESASAERKYNLPYKNNSNKNNNNNNEDDDDDARDEVDVVDDVEMEQQMRPGDSNRKALSSSSSETVAYDLEARQQSAPQEIAQRHGQRLGGKYATPTPHKYWTSRCQAANGICPREYSRAMLAVRNREAVARLRHQLEDMQDQLDSENEDANSDADSSDSSEDGNLKSTNNEVFMLLTGEQDLAKFLHWAMELLYPKQHADDNLSASAADFYHPGMFIWKKLNFSGHLEPPLIVDEPQYVLVRREKQNLKDSYQLGDDFKVKDDPFIPPRGRKHSSPDLEELFQRHEAFVPNRGKRDKVKDLFKYDDLFYPNRGKKHRDIFQLDDPFFPHRGKKLHLRDLYNVDDPFFPNRGKRQWTATPIVKRSLPSSKWAKQQRNLNSDNNNNNNHKGDNWLQRMSTHEINGNDQSVKPSMSTEDATLGASWQHQPQQLQLPQSANRLQPTRSMSANLQRLRFIVNPSMRQQQQQQHRQHQQHQQVKTSWPAGANNINQHRWQRSVHDARETQLTRVPNNAADTSPGHDTDIDIDYGQLDM